MNLPNIMKNIFKYTIFTLALVSMIGFGSLSQAKAASAQGTLWEVGKAQVQSGQQASIKDAVKSIASRFSVSIPEWNWNIAGKYDAKKLSVSFLKSIASALGIITTQAAEGPVVTITSGPGTYTNNKNVVFNFESSVVDSTFLCTIGTSIDKPCSSPFSYTLDSDGNYSLSVTAIDSFGNVGSPAMKFFNYDSTKPKITITSVAPTTTLDASLGFWGNLSDTGSQLKSANVTATPGSYSSIIDIKNEINFTRTIPLDLGLNTIVITATDNAGNIASSTFTVNRVAAGALPIITEQPTDSLPLAAGTLVTFKVQASGEGLTYQWYKDPTTIIPGATTSGYTFTTTLADNGSKYYVVISNAGGSVNSNPAKLTVVAPTLPMIMFQPTDQTADNGINATFSVTATGTGPLSYKWYQYCGVGVFDYLYPITGTTITSVLAGKSTDHCQYRVIVTNSVGSVESSIAVLHVNYPIVIPAPALNVTPTTLNGGTTTSTLTNFLYKPGSGTPMMPTYAYECAFDGGATPMYYSCGSDGIGGLVSWSQTLMVGPHTFSVRLKNPIAGGAPSPSTTWNWTIISAPSGIIIPANQPADEMVSLGGIAHFFVTPTGGSGSLSYQWYDNNGGAIPGATQSSLDIMGTLYNFNTEYYVVVKDSALNTATSRTAILRVAAGVVVGKPIITNQPANPTNINNAYFTFYSNTEGVIFVCALDGSPTTPPTICNGNMGNASQNYSGLAQGTHVFSVQATLNGLSSEVASYPWTINPVTTPTTLSITGTTGNGEDINTMGTLKTTSDKASFSVDLKVYPPTTITENTVKINGSTRMIATDGKYNFDLNNGLVVGPNEFYVFVKDSAGVSFERTLKWTISAPSIPTTVIVTGKTGKGEIIDDTGTAQTTSNSASYTIKVGVTLPTKIIKYQINTNGVLIDIPITPANLATYIHQMNSLSSGQNSGYVYIVDSIGKSFTFNFKWIVLGQSDTTKPTLFNDTPCKDTLGKQECSATVSTKNITISGQVYDEVGGSGLNKLEVIVKDPNGNNSNYYPTVNSNNTFSLSLNLSDVGVYYITEKAYDIAGNYTVFVKTITREIVAPTVAIKADVNGIVIRDGESTTSSKINLVSTFPGESIKSLEFIFDGVSKVCNPPDFCNMIASVFPIGQLIGTPSLVMGDIVDVIFKDVQTFAPGLHNFTAKVTNNSDLTGTASFNWTVILPKLAPNIPTNLTPVDGAIINDTRRPTFSFEITDPNINDEVFYEIIFATDVDFNNIIHSKIGDLSLQGMQSYTLTIDAPDGTYYWKVRAYDQSKLVSDYTSPRSITVSLDIEAPITTLNTITTPTTDPNLIISGTIADIGSGVNTFTINGTPVTLATNGSFNYPTTLAFGVNTFTFIAVDNVGNSATQVITITLVNPDTDGDGINDDVDQCKDIPGTAQYNGCPFGESKTIKLHIVDNTGNNCPLKNGKKQTSCEIAYNGAEVKAFAIDSKFIAAFGNAQGQWGSKLNVMFTSDISLINSGTTNSDGTVMIGLPTQGKVLNVAKFSIGGKTAYAARKVNLQSCDKDSEADDGDTAGCSNNFKSKFIRANLLYKNGVLEKITAVAKTMFTGSLLEVIYPEYTVWEQDVEYYPFIMTSDSDWTTDICMQVPQGYKITAVMDAEGNLMPTNECQQAFVSGETKVILFQVTDYESPEPNLTFSLKTKHQEAGSSVINETTDTVSVGGIREVTKSVEDVRLIAAIAPIVAEIQAEKQTKLEADKLAITQAEEVARAEALKKAQAEATRQVEIIKAELAAKNIQMTAAQEQKLTAKIVSKLLKEGSKGEEVRFLQKYLNENGILVAKSGAGSRGMETTYFGSKTREAVKKFQSIKGLEVDGIVGSNTRSVLNK